MVFGTLGGGRELCAASSWIVVGESGKKVDQEHFDVRLVDGFCVGDFCCVYFSVADIDCSVVTFSMHDALYTARVGSAQLFSKIVQKNCVGICNCGGGGFGYYVANVWVGDVISNHVKNP